MHHLATLAGCLLAKQDKDHSQQEKTNPPLGTAAPNDGPPEQPYTIAINIIHRGIRFLKHVERTHIIAHLLNLTQLTEDGEEADLEQLFDCINAELELFSEELAVREQIVVLTKCDAVSSPERVEEFTRRFKARGYDVAVISSVVGKGIDELIERLAQSVFKAPSVGAETL